MNVVGNWRSAEPLPEDSQSKLVNRSQEERGVSKEAMDGEITGPSGVHGDYRLIFVHRRKLLSTYWGIADHDAETSTNPERGKTAVVLDRKLLSTIRALNRSTTQDDHWPSGLA
jgi:hypothetical protein